jgi:hypothetical protein
MIRYAVTLLCATFPFATLATGCGNSCDDLAEVCGNCGDEDYRISCEVTVEDGNQELCSQRRGEFNTRCPPPEDTTSSTTTTGSTTGGGAPATGGNGGAPAAGGNGGAPATGGAPAAGGSGGTAGAGGN